MTTRPLADRLAGPDTSAGRAPFLGTHRATAACKRELDRLNEELVRRLTAIQAAGAGDVFDVRTSPDRCIVQLGPVALTVVWLRGARDSVAEGELLVNVWRGVAGKRLAHQPERPGAARLPSATVLWEEVLVPVATDEATWGWQPRSAATDAWASPELAARCVERLHGAYAGAGTAAEITSPS